MDVSDIFYFFCSGEGKGESGATGGGGGLLKIPGGGGGPREGGRGAGRVSAANWLNILGGGGKYFIGGPKCPPSWSLQLQRVW